MHKFLKTIGFSEYNTTKKINILKEDVVHNPTRKDAIECGEEIIFSYEKDYGECFGICVIKIGETEKESEFDSIFPYVKGYNYLYNEKFEIDPISDREGFYASCDDNNIGIPMIFFISNPVEFRKKQGSLQDPDFGCYATLSGLAADGIILLPIEKDESQIRKERKENEVRNHMINEAKMGSVEAMEKLTIKDMSTFTCVNIRSKKEDLFTIVSSFFMPYTVECDKYSILGDITDVIPVKNKITNEELYYLSLDCNGIEFQLLVNKKDLIGIPEVGRRYKGHIWMQGQIDEV